MPQLAVFPKCFLDDLIVHKSMTLFDWIGQAGQLGVDGLEMHYLFFEGVTDAYLDKVSAACAAAGLAIPMLCFSTVGDIHTFPSKRQANIFANASLSPGHQRVPAR